MNILRITELQPIVTLNEEKNRTKKMYIENEEAKTFSIMRLVRLCWCDRLDRTEISKRAQNGKKETESRQRKKIGVLFVKKQKRCPSFKIHLY